MRLRTFARCMLNRTKLRPPSRKGPLIERDRLLARVELAEHSRLTVIHAPPGFGKTSLLLQLHERLQARKIRVAWLSLEASDNDYSRYLGYLALALKQAGVRVDSQSLEEGAPNHRPAPAIASAVLSGAIARLEQNAVICIDDYHVLTDAKIGELMTRLIQGMTDRLSWVIATRTTPAHVPLGRLRALKELTSVGMTDLQFSEDEAHALMRENVPVHLELSQVRALNVRTEGWAAALQIAVLLMKHSVEPACVIERFSGSYRNVAELLDEEVLAPLGDPITQFLFDTSVLPRMSTELCNHVLQRTDARRTLDSLESLNLFIFCLDEERSWYRYHHLFAEFLNRRLKEADPERWAQLHARASVWFEKNGMPLEALEHALLAQDFWRSAWLLDQLHLFSSGHIGAVERYARQIPEEVLESFPNLQLERIWEWEGEWDFPRARAGLRRLARKVGQWTSGREVVPGHVDVETIQAKLEHREMLLSFAADDVAETERRCLKWFGAGHVVDEYTQCAFEVAYLYARREHYRCKEPLASGAPLGGQPSTRPPDFGSIYYNSVSGLSLLMQGCVDEAEALYRRAFDYASKNYGRLSSIAVLPGLLLSEVHYERNRLDEARALIGDYLEIAGTQGFVDKLISGHITRARIEFVASRGDPRAARRVLDEAERCARDRGFERLRLNVLTERIRQLALSGDQEEAFFLAKKEKLLGSCSAFVPRDGVTSREELLALSWARVAALRGNSDGALRLLKQWYQFTLGRSCYRPTINIALELARQLCAREDTTAASQYVRNALRLAQGRFIRSFLDAGPGVREILGGLGIGKRTAGTEQARYAEFLLAEAARESARDFAGEGVGYAAEPAPGPTAAEASFNPVFGKRELDILELAADDLSNREISRRLAISENTVKWYWRAIFRKLRVHRRGKAVSVARSTGLIF